jgi:hypothetical protein
VKVLCWHSSEEAEGNQNIRSHDDNLQVIDRNRDLKTTCLEHCTSNLLPEEGYIMPSEMER